MKIYLVGGAVRDQLLGYPVKERDWVVVGARPDEMEERGFQKVGKDFPVYLHPKTKDEYALARTERKLGRGYYGFQCDFNPEVSLEDDLLRRDLTINAMAMDENGQLIDPYGGKWDLQNKILRHVSPAFSEDPVRVLRVARFAARYYHLGFKLAEDTRNLMYQMAREGELDYLVPERVWQEWQRSLTETNPEVFITTLRACGALQIIFPEIEALFGVPNPVAYHPEIDTGIHSLWVLAAAAKMSTDPEIRFAAFLHDLGKAGSPISAWPKHHGHEERSEKIVAALCQRLRIPAQYRDLALTVASQHGNLHRLFELRPNTIVKFLEETDAFRRPERFGKVVIATEADAQGRGFVVDYRQAKVWAEILNELMTIEVKPLLEEGYTGAGIKSALHQRRVARVELIKKSWNTNEK